MPSGESSETMRDLSENLINTLRESLLVLDLDLRVKTANLAFYRTFEMAREDVEHRPLPELGGGQWNIPSLLEALRGLGAEDTWVHDFEVEYHHPRLGPRVMLLNARAMAGAEEPEPLIVLVIDDVTQERQAAATLQEYLRRLEWSNRELQDFAYIASHDLQEPLRAIQAFSDRLQQRYSANLDEQGLDYLTRIQRAAGRMRQLISDLLAYSRVTTQGSPFVPVDLGEVARECVADLNRRLEETGGRITVGSLPVVEGDPTQLRQLIQNLLDNGLKFHRELDPPYVSIREVSGGVRAETSGIETAPGQASHGAVSHFIVVEDNGIGFDEKFLDRIFSPFERLHNQSRYPGTGIGLAVCRRIVERHSGSLTATSIEGQGTTFHLVLPALQPVLLGVVPGAAPVVSENGALS